MGKAIVMHVDEAPWQMGRAPGEGEPRLRGMQLALEEPEGPRVSVTSFPPNHVVEPHSHSVWEVLLVIEGELTMGDRRCGPGTLIYMEQGTVYGFVTGPEGARFVGFRPKRPETTYAGKDGE